MSKQSSVTRPRAWRGTIIVWSARVTLSRVIILPNYISTTTAVDMRNISSNLFAFSKYIIHFNLISPLLFYLKEINLSTYDIWSRFFIEVRKHKPKMGWK